ncbi:DUF5025 domain-containing protein [uncultured Mucilaginibacter sp.]|uniref:DUF5025 domain-containing protein n=1 Tax=uncultured Mucilaginibacter sp. TaxID=797541 RepID=UPI0025ED8CD7|nr:DUF5025 domain-containing protein [uncultured Mucilaginibacter sp.]
MINTRIALLNMSLTLSAALSITSCSKTRVAKPQPEEFVQHFKANIAGKEISIENTRDRNRTQLTGQWTGLGNGDGTEKSIYTVDVILPADISPISAQARLRVQVENVKKGEFLITGENKDYPPYKSLISLRNSNISYSANTAKKPFEVEITRYEYPYGSMVPYVGGKLNGVLYNEKNLQDSIIIKDGTFEVRF